MGRAGFVFGVVLTLATAGGAAAGTLDTARQRGAVICGVSTGVAGFSLADEQGVQKGLDSDFCRAVAAAVFGDATKVKYIKTTSKDRFTVLQSGEIDLLARNSTWSLSRDTQFGLNFTGVNYFDGQGFMVRKSLNLKSAKDLAGASICVQQGTTTELNLADYFRANNLKFEPVVFEQIDDVTKAYDAGRCDAITNDASGLYTNRLKLEKPDDHIVLPEVISKEPLGPIVRHGDDQWFDIVKWVHYAMVNAEEAGVSSANVDAMLKSTNPDVRRLLGAEGEFGKGLGLGNDWVAQIVKQVGNYGEVFERNLGLSTRLKIERGQNKLWTQGGLQYAPPIR
ncbi:MAG: amino acid ABC transporter substrate-binding protein [Rhizobiales bacterium]|nr:amino acid ABC transporter substrate-binding protein [Hyphomicrobiales bacterium]